MDVKDTLTNSPVLCERERVPHELPRYMMPRKIDSIRINQSISPTKTRSPSKLVGIDSKSSTISTSSSIKYTSTTPRSYEKESLDKNLPTPPSEVPRYMMPRKNDSIRQIRPSSTSPIKPRPMTFAVDPKAASTIFANESRSSKKRSSVISNNDTSPEKLQVFQYNSNHVSPSSNDIPRYMMPRKIDSSRILTQTSTSPMRPRPMIFAVDRPLTNNAPIISTSPPPGLPVSSETLSPGRKSVEISTNVIPSISDSLRLNIERSSPDSSYETISLKAVSDIEGIVKNVMKPPSPISTITSTSPELEQDVPESVINSAEPLISTETATVPKTTIKSQFITTAAVAPPKLPFTPLSIDEKLALYKDDIMSSNNESHLPATQLLRRLLSVQINPPIDQVISLNLVPVLVTFLDRSESPKLQFEAAWALSNVASGSSAHTQAVIDAGAVQHFVRLLVSPNANVREQAAWALGNIAGDSILSRDFVLMSGVIPVAIEAHKMNGESDINSSSSITRTQSWMISNLCRGKPAPQLDIASPVLLLLFTLLKSADAEVRINVCYSLSHLTAADEWIQPVLDADLGTPVIELLDSGDKSIHDAAVRTVGNIISGSDSQTQIMIQLNVLPTLVRLLDHPRSKTRKEICWTFSNITAGTLSQIQAVLDAGAIPKMFELLKIATDETEFDLHKEIAWTVCNAATQGTMDQKLFIVKLGGVPAICSFLSTSDKKVLTIVLEALKSILKLQGYVYGDEKELVEVISLFKECKGDINIKALMSHSWDRVCDMASEIATHFFSYLLE